MRVSEHNQCNLRSGVGVVLVNKNNEIFVGKRIVYNNKNTNFSIKHPWQMPQGGIEKGEQPVHAAYRELLEEVGTNNVELIAESSCWLQYIIPLSMRRRHSKFIGQKQKWFLLKFLGDDSDFDLNFSDDREFDNWKWVSAIDVIKSAVHFKKQLYVDIFNEFYQYIGFDKPFVIDEIVDEDCDDQLELK